MKQVRVLVSMTRQPCVAIISATLARDPAISVVGEAANPYEAREAIKALNPDVVTLDVEMPHMNGSGVSRKDYATAAFASRHGIFDDGKWRRHSNQGRRNGCCRLRGQAFCL